MTFFSLHSQVKQEFYRSNKNGMELVKITNNETSQYEYVLYVFFNTEDLAVNKILYENKKEIKRWQYFYNEDKLSYEKYFKENLLKEEYWYDENRHKIKQVEYKNRDKIRILTYSYNSDGLVDVENSLNLVTGQRVISKYRYDTQFRIKQIEKKYPDGRLVFWEAFFDSQGIVQREYYTLNNEKFIFIYNANGQEISGQVLEILENKEEKTKKEWTNEYSGAGKKTKREEKNYLKDQVIKTWYNNKLKETRIEVYQNNESVTIENFEYNQDNKISEYELIKDLNSYKTFYEYNEKKEMVKTTEFQNEVLKKGTLYHEDGSWTEIIYSKDHKRVVIEYDEDGNILSQKLVEN